MRSTTSGWSRAATSFREVRPEAAFTLFRIGDAVAARNIHAAIYDGIRFAMRI